MLSSVGCSKKETPDPHIGTGHYTLNGRTITCQARASIDSTVVNGQRYSLLHIVLIETPQPASPAPALTLTFQRPAAFPNTTYSFSTLTYTNGSQSTSTTYVLDPGSTFNQVTGGVYSGAFAGSGPGASKITDGFYTNVRL